MLSVTNLCGFGAGGGGPPMDGLTATAAWSMGRKLFSSYSGSFYTEGSGTVAALLDQSGNSRDVSQATGGAQPAIATAGTHSRACAAFDGTNDVLVGAAMSNFISASAGYAIFSVLIDNITTDGSTVYENDAIFSENGAFAGLFLRTTGPNVHAYNWDGNVDSASASIAVSSSQVVEWRHEGGNLYVRVNGGSWSAGTTSGNTTDLTNVLRLGASYTTAGVFTDINIFEGAFFSTIPSTAAQDALVAAFQSWTG